MNDGKGRVENDLTSIRKGEIWHIAMNPSLAKQVLRCETLFKPKPIWGIRLRSASKWETVSPGRLLRLFYAWGKVTSGYRTGYPARCFTELPFFMR
jgi:hypothetical protein